jgi:hypothetical protein
MTCRFFSFRSRFHFAVMAIVVATILFSLSPRLRAQQQVTEPPYISGQTLTHNGFVQVALDGETGKTVFIFTPNKAPMPTHTNGIAQAPIYLVVYPMDSAIPADHLDCTVYNCKGLNVLPFGNADYGDLGPSNPACGTFNGGNDCSEVKGHDHIVGTPFTGGDFNVAWKKVLVVFTHAGFQSGAINTRITSVQQLDGLIADGYVRTIDVPASSFNCSLVPETIYNLGNPVSVSYP